MTGISRFLELSAECNAHEQRLKEAARRPSIDGRDRFGPIAEVPFPRLAELAAEGLARQRELWEALAPPSDRAMDALQAITYSLEPKLAKLGLDATRDHPDPDIRWARLQTAFLVGYTRGWRDFLRALEDPSEQVRFASAQYFSFLRRSRHRRLLRDALLRVALDRAEAPRVRAKAIESVAFFPGRSVAPTLRGLAREEPEFAHVVSVQLDCRAGRRERARRAAAARGSTP